MASAGLSLGTAAALGATLGGAISQGFGPLGRRFADALQGRESLSLEDSVLLVAAQRLLGLHFALQSRGHAAEGRVELERNAVAMERLQSVLGALQPARAHPEWAAEDSPRREAARRELLARLRQVA